MANKGSAHVKRGPKEGKANINPNKTIELTLDQLDKFVQNGSDVIKLPEISSPTARAHRTNELDRRLANRLKQCAANAFEENQNP